MRGKEEVLITARCRVRINSTHCHLAKLENISKIIQKNFQNNVKIGDIDNQIINSE